MTNIDWRWFTFEDLGVARLYQLLRLRTEVFVVEQDCVYQDLDNRDQAAWHLLGLQGEAVEACIRLLPPGLAYRDCAAIGRVVTSARLRGMGQGRPMMQHAIDKSRALFPGVPIKLSGQQHLRGFYESLGFQVVGEPYMEDGIPHLAMRREADPR